MRQTQSVVVCHFDFKTLCTPMMPEYSFSCQQWCHYWRWKCVQCTSEMQEPRRGRVPLLTNWDTDLCVPENIRWLYMWCEGLWRIWQRFLRPTDSWVGKWEQGTADRRLATCLRASVAYDHTVAVHPLQSNDWSSLEFISFCFVFLLFRFSCFCIIPFHFRLCRFLRFHFHLHLQIHYFFINGYFRFHFP